MFLGNTAYLQRLHSSLSPNCTVNVYSITLSPVTGVHADPPMHHAKGGKASGEPDLTPHLGKCRVVHCIGCAPLASPEHIADPLYEYLPPYVLLRTSRTAGQSWGLFTAIAPKTVAELATKNVAYVGIDTPSVDPAENRNLPSYPNCWLTTCACSNAWCSTTRLKVTMN